MKWRLRNMVLSAGATADLDTVFGSGRSERSGRRSHILMGGVQVANLRRGRGRPRHKLPVGVAVFFQQMYHMLQIGVTGSEGAREPVPASLRNLFTVGNDVKLTGVASNNDRCNAHALVDEGCETRNLSLVVSSGGARNNLNFHSCSDQSRAGELAITSCIGPDRHLRGLRATCAIRR